MDKRRFGTFINHLRKEKGITQKELAEILHVTDKAVSRWETGKSYPDIEVMQKLAEYFDVSVNELLQGERIAEEEIKTVSDRNVIGAFKRLKQNKQKNMAVVAILSSIVVILGCLLVTPVGNFIHGVKATKLEIPSKDTEAILSCVDGYISSETGGSADLYEIDIMMHGDKTIENMHIDGASVSGTTFFCSVSQDLETFPYIYIHEDRDVVDVESHINTENIKGFINAVDLKKIDDDFTINTRYDVTLVEMSDEDYTIELNNDNKKYIYDPGKEYFRELKQDDLVKGPYALISVSKYEEDGTGTSIADVYWPVELQSDYYIIYDGNGNYVDSYGNSANNIDALTDDSPAVSRLVTDIEAELLDPASYIEIQPLKNKIGKAIYREITMINNSVYILTKEDGSGWKLNKGNSLVYEYEKKENEIVDSQTLLIGVIQNGAMKEYEVFRDKEGRFSFTAEEDGEYYIYLLSASSETQTITENILRINN